MYLKNTKDTMIEGKLFINPDMDIDYVLAQKEEFESRVRLSIIWALSWLEKNVLTNKYSGFFLRQKLKEGLKFDKDTETYLRNSYNFWVRKLNEYGDVKKLSDEDILEHLYNNTQHINLNKDLDSDISSNSLGEHSDFSDSPVLEITIPKEKVGELLKLVVG